MSKYQTTQTGRPYAEVRGYLRQPLELPTVVEETGLLTPSFAILAAYSKDPAGVWRYIGDVTVYAYDESVYASPLYYVRASLNSDNLHEVFWTGCSATLLTIPVSRQTAVIDRVDNSAAPPPAVAGDRYLLDDSVGGVHGDWNGSSANQIVQFNGSVWVSFGPAHRWIVTVTALAADWQYSALAPTGWVEV
tara:strand:+ start:2763 stop:3335 length:573 start_codon:yes stop_codon:yes gene_type:complete